MNALDKQYTALLQDILDNGVKKQDRTGTGTLSVFGRQIRHKMSEGFPLLTTKKMPFRLIATELMWFLRGDTNIKYLVDNDCHIWDGDAYKAYLKKYEKDKLHGVIYENDETQNRPFSKEEFVNWVKNNDKFSKLYGDLGPIYGKQWRSWGRKNVTNYDLKDVKSSDQHKVIKAIENGEDVTKYGVKIEYQNNSIDQIANLINDLKTNPDSRRLMVNAWNVGELDQMTLPPCHYGFQVYTRELSLDERYKLANINENKEKLPGEPNYTEEQQHSLLDELVPKRAISLMWNQRSVDTFLGLPFNIACYGLLLEIIAKAVNMVPDELIGNLGDTHLYLNHVEQAKEQIGREFSFDERVEYFKKTYPGEWDEYELPKDNFSWYNIPTRTREPYPLPTLNINTEWWPTESGECGVGPIDAVAVVEGFSNDNFCKCLLEEDLQLGNYQSHPHIKAPLSN
jgi:thymidylate synthase